MNSHSEHMTRVQNGALLPTPLLSPQAMSAAMSAAMQASIFSFNNCVSLHSDYDNHYDYNYSNQQHFSPGLPNNYFRNRRNNPY